MSFSVISHHVAKIWNSRWIYPLVLILGVFAIFWITTFKIMDRDFWWHITAGEIMFKTHHIITVDPFAYTRAGLPYYASYEWISQIILYLIYHLGGSTAIILFRGVVATTCIGLLLQITKKKHILYILLGVWAIVMTKGSYLERPQLFSFIFFCGFLLLAFTFLDSDSARARKKICATYIGLIYLWVNMHGGAAILGCLVVSFLLVQTAANMIDGYKRFENLREAQWLLGTLVLMGVALFLPPNGLNALHYLSQLLNDQTIAFIAEFQPRAWGLYIWELWPFFALSITALIVGRRHWVFNGLLLLMTIYLSRQAFRHEVFFVYSAVATCFYQFDRSARMERVWAWMTTYAARMALATLLLILFLSHIAYARSFGFERQDNLFGYGQFDFARGAYDFVEREHITGNMFNTYGIGGYLIHRGYPDRKVFIDGRNVDYGFDFMARAYAAGASADRWDELVHRYKMTYAIVDYDAIKQKSTLPYSQVLDTDPDWPLVYLDDWTAVYLKRTPENQKLIAQFAYKHVNATLLQFDSGFSHVAKADIPALRKELQRIQADNPLGIKATMALAQQALRDGRSGDVQKLVTQAHNVRPYDPEPLAILAGLYLNAGEWEKAADTYTEILRLAGDNYPDIDYAFIANVYAKAGHPWKAWYWRLGLPTAKAPAHTGTGSVSSGKPAPMVNPATDAQDFNDQGLAQAESGQLVEAEQSFRTALKINPSSAEAWNNLCALLLGLKRDTEAIEACQRAVALYPEYGDAHYNLAIGFLHMNNLKQAKAEALLAKKWGHAKEADVLLSIIAKRSN